MNLDLIVCPNCEGDLNISNETLVCSACDAEYPVRHGIPCFDETDPFYDAYLKEHCPYARSPQGLKRAILEVLPFWSWREWQFWNRVIPGCERLLDFGCGRGREIFVDRARETVGYDVSFRTIKECQRHYDIAVQGALPHFPFASASFDVVVSSHVIGHIGMDAKETMVAEIARLTRQGGLTAHVIETDSEHPMVEAAKENPDVYRQQYIEQDGHIGLEYADAVIERFEDHGFQLKELRPVDASFPSVQTFNKYLSHPELDDLPGADRVRFLERMKHGNAVTNLAYEVGMGAFHRTYEKWLGDPRKAQFIIVAFERL